MKKGFTLIELTAVIVILGVISLIVIPLVDQSITQIKTDAYKTQIESIRTGAREWAANNIGILPASDGDSLVKTLLELQQAGYVKTDITNPITKLAFAGTLEVTIINDNGNYVYAVGGEVDGQIDPNSPTITLNGNHLMYVDMNTTYTEPGVVAKDSSGNVIALTSTTTKRDGTTVTVPPFLTNGLYVYQIIYSVTHNSLTTQASRTVIIKDNVPPTLTIPSDATIANTVTTFDIMSGVSASDNSGQAVIIKAKTNLTLGVPGRYQITYYATDHDDNTTTKYRIITITY